MSDHETTLREAAENGLDRYAPPAYVTETLARACLAGADALRRGTCGTCKFWEQTWPGINPTRGRCENHQAPACDSETVADDGCIKGYEPTEPTR